MIRCNRRLDLARLPVGLGQACQMRYAMFITSCRRRYRLVSNYFPLYPQMTGLAPPLCRHRFGYGGKFIRRIRSWNRGSERKLSIFGSTFRKAIQNERS